MPAVPLKPQPYLQPSAPDARLNFGRRPSHDLFECIEQSKHKRLSESQARYIFAQVVEAVYYLNSQGITHCDIKDENLVIDRDLKVIIGWYLLGIIDEADGHSCAGQVDRFRKRCSSRPYSPTPILHSFLRHDRLCLLGDPSKTALPRTSRRDMDSRRVTVLPPYRTFSVSWRAGCDCGTHRTS